MFFGWIICRNINRDDVWEDGMNDDFYWTLFNWKQSERLREAGNSIQRELDKKRKQKENDDKSKED